MNNALKIGGILILLQAVLLGAFFIYSRRRQEPPENSPLLAPAVQTAGELLLPSVQVRGMPRAPLSLDSRPTLIHFWATWCAPCRDELPGLLALDGPELRVIAVALDREWQAVENFFEGQVPEQVVLGSSDEAQQLLGVQSLPVSFLIRPGLEGYARFDGPRAWEKEGWREQWWPSGAP